MSEPSIQHQPLIRARGLTRLYRPGAAEVVGIADVDLDISRGELVVLKGNSGSGKSTLLGLLGGLDLPTKGSLSVDGRDLAHLSQAELTRYRREVVGMVFQSFNLLPTLSVCENVCLPGLLAGRPAREVSTHAGELLEWLQLSPRSGHLPAELSGGEMQRTAIARALINEPSIILADEPTGNLDSRNGEIVIGLLTELNRTSGRTVVIATHSDMADAYATMKISLRDGRIVEAACIP
ncbi:MAG: ABC transporter ATP-binding protein [Syntrophobacteraceae bacterium]